MKQKRKYIMSLLGNPPPPSGEKHYNSITYFESGRSMVEMLATLAVVAVLSVVGLAMWGKVMDKHRANTLLGEANKRASNVAAQISMMGKDGNSISVADFPNPTGYVFGVEKNPLNANQFNITIDGVDTDVCTQMKNAVGDGTVIRVISEFCDKLTYNNDLSKTAYASDAQTATECSGLGTWCTLGDNGASTKCSENTDCCSGVTYDAQCQTCTSATGAVSNKSNTTPCDFDGDGVNDSVCNTGVCVDPTVTNGATCTSNADCGGAGSGYYCKITYDAATNLAIASVNTTSTACYKDLTGTCTVAPHPTRLTAAQENILHQAGFASSTVIGPNGLNWWNANNWCLAQGKHLLDISEIDCHRKTSDSTTNNSVVQGAQTSAYCCKDGQECLQSSWHTTLWNDKNILAGKAEEVAKYADKMVALRKTFGETRFWTASPYNVASDNSCYAFQVFVGEGRAIQGLRTYGYRTLCE